MASACVNNIPTTNHSSYGWLTPRLSLSREYKDDDSKHSKSKSKESSSPKDTGDFEFRLGDNVTMLPADELFLDGKLVPLHLSSAKLAPMPSNPPEEDVKSPKKPCTEDQSLFSPKAPRCSSRWRELLGLKKLPQNTNKTASSLSIRQFLNRNSKTVTSSTDSDTSLSSPLLLKDCSSLEYESICISSSRISLSSSSSGHDHDELPRLSLDAEKPNTVTQRNRSVSSGPKVRPVRSRIRKEKTAVSRGVSVDSPRMNPSGRVVFQSLERSSSSPSSFNGGPRHNKQNRGVMERSYSANVRITPVLNVPVCSLRGSSKSGVFGFGQLFSSSSSQPQKKEGCNNGNTRNHHQQHHSSNRNKKEKEKEKEKERS